MPRLTLTRGMTWSLVQLVEVAVFPAGFCLSYRLAILIEKEQGSEDVAAAAFFVGIAFSVALLLWALRRTRNWKFRYNMEGWRLEREERRLHPRRAKWKRRGRMILVWVPSLFATIVLLFYPYLSHVFFHDAGNLQYYRVPVPWHWFVVGTTSWQSHQRSVDVVVYAGGGRGFGIVPFWRTSRMLA